MVSKTQEWILKRKALALPLSPTMQRGTIQYFKQKYWNTIRQRTKNSGHFQDNPKNSSYAKNGIFLEMTREEFYSWVDANWDKISALYAAGKTPSIDRVDNLKGYSASNIQAIDLFENMAKDRRKALIASNENCSIEFESARAAAAAEFGFDWKQISTAIKRKTKHKGYYWRFK